MPFPDAFTLADALTRQHSLDLKKLLNAMAASVGGATTVPPAAATDTVFLAWTTGDVAEEREKLRRELEARNYRVVPTGAPPLDAAGVRERIVAALHDAKVAVHLIGALYGFVPEGEERSVVELQSDEALYHASASTAARIFWLAPNAQPSTPWTTPSRSSQTRPCTGRTSAWRIGKPVTHFGPGKPPI